MYFVIYDLFTCEHDAMALVPPVLCGAQLNLNHISP